jgi:hypothetical protein
MKTLSIILAAVLLAGSASAEQVTGQVFIVTAGHQTFKLALVPVAIYDAQIVKGVADELRGSTVVEANNFIETIDKPVRALKEKAYQQLRSAATEVYGTRYSSTYAFHSKCAALQSDSLNYMTYLISSKRLFERMPAPIAGTKTDADGNFEIDMPDRNRAVILAATTRMVFDKTESYHWIIPLAGTTGKIMLSNDNMASSLPTESPAHYPEAAVVTPSLASIAARLNELRSSLETSGSKSAPISKTKKPGASGGHN